MKNILALAIGSLVLFVAARAHAVAPETIGFTGRLTTVSGETVAGEVDISFAFFPDESSGTPMRTELHRDVPVDDGFVFVALGQAGGGTSGIDVSGDSLRTVLSDGGVLWLEVQVDSDVLGPRIPIHSVPYAVQAQRARTADLLGTIGPSDVITTPPCAANQLLKRNASNTAWECAHASGVSCAVERATATGNVVSVSCPDPSQIVTGGGCDGGGEPISVSAPDDAAGLARGWVCKLPGTMATVLTAYAICCAP